MKLTEYLADHAVPLGVGIGVIALLSLMLSMLGVGLAAVAFLGAIMVTGTGFAAAYGYLRKRRFYSELESIVWALGERSEAYLAAELMDRPQFIEGRIAYDAIGAAGKSMNDEIARYREMVEAYREYVEMWIHEIKTPLAAARLISSDLHGAEADKLKTEIGRIEAYVEQALYYARSTSLEKDYSIREVDLESVVRDAVKKNAQLLIGAGVGVSVEADGDPTVFADAKWLQFVIGQLLANAAKYDSTAIKTTIRTEDAGTSMARTVLEIADDGCGIPADDLERVFEKGFTGRNGRTHGSSTGMGLYLCTTMCTEMGLGLGIASEDEKGTRVMVSFPHDRRRLDLSR